MMNAEPVEFVGPFEFYDVAVHGRLVPHLQATMHPGGKVLLQLDRRFAVEIDAQAVEHVVPFIANCIAVAAGYTCHPEPDWGEPRRSHPMPLAIDCTPPAAGDGRSLDLPNGPGADDATREEDH